MEGRGQPPVLTVRVPLTVSTYERLGRLARDSGSTVEDHAGSLLAGAIGGERWTDGGDGLGRVKVHDAIEVAEQRLNLELRDADAREGAATAARGPAHNATRVGFSTRERRSDPGPMLEGFGASPVGPLEGSS
jgi:hypothetical protein